MKIYNIFYKSIFLAALLCLSCEYDGREFENAYTKARANTPCTSGYFKHDNICKERTDEQCGNDNEDPVKCKDNQECRADNKGRYACQCKDNFATCDGSECDIDLLSDPKHCGQCGRSCQRGEKCLAGICTCADSSGKPITDFSNNPEHCGSCGYSCGKGNKCINGVCACSEKTNDGKQWATCEGKADCQTDIQSDPLHCGGCNIQCPNPGGGTAQPLCKQGKCQCAPNYNLCRDGESFQCLINSNDSCGKECKKCPPNSHCAESENAAYACKCNEGYTTITQDDTIRCVDPQNDPEHCGENLVNCKGHRGTPYCAQGQCVQCLERGHCASEYFCSDNSCQYCPNTVCDNNCVNTSIHPDHCGGCDNRCGVGINEGKPYCHYRNCYAYECFSDNDCQGKTNTPYCHNGKCVECKQKEHCAANKYCSTYSYKCSNCGGTLCGNTCVSDFHNNNEHCGKCDNKCGEYVNYGKNYCNNGKCVECFNNSQCGGDTPYCCLGDDCSKDVYWQNHGQQRFDLKNTCVGCDTKYDCKNQALGCHVYLYGNPPYHYVKKHCECNNDSDCKGNQYCQFYTDKNFGICLPKNTSSSTVFEHL